MKEIKQKTQHQSHAQVSLPSLVLKHKRLYNGMLLQSKQSIFFFHIKNKLTNNGITLTSINNYVRSNTYVLT